MPAHFNPSTTGHSFSSQASPLQDALHTQEPFTHRPFPLQSIGSHRLIVHRAPEKPSAQSHFPSMQTPLPAHSLPFFARQPATFSLQSSPTKPLEHSQCFPASSSLATHFPFPEQSFLQVGWRHCLPVQPGAHLQVPFEHLPRLWHFIVHALLSHAFPV